MAFLGLLIYFFCLYIRPQDWVNPFIGWPVDYIVFGFMFVAGFLQGLLKKIPSAFGMRQTKAMMWWVFAVAASNFFNGHFDQVTEFLVKYVKFLVIFVTFAVYIDSFGKMKHLFLFIILLTCALAFQALYQKQHGVGWAGQPLGWLGRVVWIGLWDGMNVLCLLFVVAFPFILQFLGKVWEFRYRLYATIAIPIVMMGIYLTQSRGGFMSLLTILFLHFRTRVKGFFGIVLGVGLVGTLIVFSPSRFGDFNDEDNSASGRVDMWMEAFEMVRYNPVFGIGKGNFLNYTGKLIAHNSFLEVMGETGMFGLFLWLSVIYASLKGLFMARRLITDEREKSLVEGLTICIVGYLFTSFFVTAEFELLYVLLALALATTRLKKVTIPYSFKDVRNILGIQFAGMLVFFIITRVYYKVF